MASTQETRVYSALFSTTLDDHRPELADNVHNNIPLLWFMRNKGRGRDMGAGRGIRLQNGGARVKIPIIWQPNSNARSYSGYETLIASATDEITVGIEDLKQVACTVGISGEEMSQNQGMAAKRDLLRDKLDIAELSLQDEIERQLVQGVASGTTYMTAGNGGKDMLPLAYLIQKNFGTSAQVHTIQQTAETWWRNQEFLSAAGTSYVTFKKEMFNLYNDCSKGSTNDGPDLILCDQNYFEAYENALVTQQRYGNYGDEAAAGAGFVALMFKGATMMWSDKVPNLGTTNADAPSTTQTNTQAVAFYLNTRWMELVVASDVNFVATPFVEPYDQDAIWAKVLFRAQMTIKQRRKLGVHYDVPAANLT